MNQVMLRAEGLSKEYFVGDRRLMVLKDVTLSIDQGMFVVVSGSSGSGKSTLLSLLSGIDRPSSGKVLIEETDITNLPERGLASIRNRLIGFVFQSFHLVPSLNALENVMFPAELKKVPDSYEKAVSLLKRVGLWERRMNMVQQLSGGEKQRVAICRALINKPRLVFADEPTGNLDSENSRDVINLLMELHREYRTTLVMATHNDEISELADRVLHLRDGLLIRDEFRS